MRRFDLLANAVYQSLHAWLAYRIREQARSHISTQLQPLDRFTQFNNRPAHRPLLHRIALAAPANN